MPNTKTSVDPEGFSAEERVSAYPDALPPTQVMTVAEWIAVAPNPHQRDTDRHLVTAVHLRTPSLAHLQVNAARLPDGSLIKLDGHTRARLWEVEPGLAPRAVSVTVYDLESIDAATALYHHFDARAAVDTATDDLSGAFRASRFHPKSALFRLYKGGGAIKNATFYMIGGGGLRTGGDIFRFVPKWLPELEAIDGIGATPQRFPAPMITAALLTIRRRGEGAVEIWARHQRDAGIKTETEMDGVEVLPRELLADGANSSSAQQRAIGRAIACVESVLAGRNIAVSGPGSWVKRGISPIVYCQRHMRREMRSFEDLLAGARQHNADRQRSRHALRKLLLGALPSDVRH